MEEDIKVKKTNSFNEFHTLPENLYALNLNNKKMCVLFEGLQLPISLTELYLAHNELIEIPATVTDLPNLKILDVSCNKIQYFDNVPNFCHQIKSLNISKNNLLGPPYWIWAELPRNLVNIDLSFNQNLTSSFYNSWYFEEILQCKTQVTEVKINNCKLTNHMELLSTFSKIKYLEFGSNDLSHYPTINKVEEMPCKGLETCCDIEKLNLSNTYLYIINKNIKIFQNLREINLSQNKLRDIPNEFCCLENLEICIFSLNNILYLPEDFVKLKKLVMLLLDSNELCMLPDNISDLHQLKRLDLYDNKLYEIPRGIERILEIDLAQNYFEEPDNDEYVQKRNMIRGSITDRFNGSKEEIQTSESDQHNSSDLELDLDDNPKTEDYDNIDRPLSSPEDWDSDEYWIPHYSRHTEQVDSPWLYYVRKKIAEGNFCPMDAHQISISEQVKYEKLHSPRTVYESDGQFDDYSEDES